MRVRPREYTGYRNGTSILDARGVRCDTLVKRVREGQDTSNAMLEHLFGSKTRVKLLTLFLHNPDEVFYVRELTRRIDTQINAVRREIENLQNIGLVVEGHAKEEDEGVRRPGLKRKYYVANRDFPLMPEVRALLIKAYVLTEWKLHEHIRKLGDVRYVAFMGIFSGQRNQPVDLFIVGDVSPQGLSQIMKKAEKELGFEINYTLMTLPEYTYRRDMSDRFLESIMKTDKTVVVNKLEGPIL